MPDKDQILSDFFAGQEPPARDPRFVAEAMTALRRRIGFEQIAFWGASATAATLVLVLSGAYLAEPLAALAPAAAPIAIIGSVLFVMRRLPMRLMKVRLI